MFWFLVLFLVVWFFLVFLERKKGWKGLDCVCGGGEGREGGRGGGEGEGSGGREEGEKGRVCSASLHSEAVSKCKMASHWLTVGVF